MDGCLFAKRIDSKARRGQVHFFVQNKKIKDILTFFPGKNTLRSLKGTTRLRECSSLSPQNSGIFLLNTFY